MSTGVSHAAGRTPSASATPGLAVLARALVVGILFGFVLIKSEAASWYRIQEMFRFQAFHMYGIIGAAVVVAAVSVAVMKRTRARTARGEAIEFVDAEATRPRVQHLLGGTAFGLGWGLLGACPGPIFALIGAGVSVMVVGLLGATAGAWVYGLLRPRLPHG